MGKKNFFFGVASAILLNCLFSVQSVFASVTKDDFPNPEGFVFIEGNTVWHKNDDLSFSKPVALINGAELTIEAGARIVFMGGEYGQSFFGIYDGMVKAFGTESDPIVITKNSDEDTFFVDFYNDSVEASLFRHVHIVGGGEVFGGGGTQSKANPLIRTAFADDSDGSPALLYDYGKLRIENSVFWDSAFSDIRSYNLAPSDDQDASFLDVVNSNFSGPSTVPALYADEHFCYWETPHCPSKVRLKNDWFGPIGGRKMVQGSDAVEGGRANELIADPVIVLPGIVGSQKNPDGSWMMDPILHAYDDLLESLKRNGYEEGVNLFPMPYDWYRSNRDTAGALGEKIGHILNQTSVSKVDVVAHSMGGLVAREYVEGSGYSGKIDQLVTLGTPHRGSPKSYLSWEAGEGFFTIAEKIFQLHLNNEAEHAGYSELYRYIRDKAPSVGELLPDYDYLYDVTDGAMRSYPDGYPRSGFLENLNAEENIAKLQSVRFTNIIGVGEHLGDENTISKIRVTGDPSVSGKWEHGMPENFGVETTDQGLEYGEGDQTVPRSSAGGSFGEHVLIASNHLDLPTNAQCHVLRILTSKTDCQFVDEWHIPNLLRLDVFSPIDIQVVSPSGKRVGKDFGTGTILDEIPGAYYTGYDGITSEFLTIPNPEKGEYRVLTQGTGEGGSYRIEATSIVEGEDGTAGESTMTTEGTAVPNEEGELTVEVDESGKVVTEAVADTTAPAVSISSPEDGKTYQNDETVPVAYSAEDETTAKENLTVNASLDDESYAKSGIDLSFLPLGAHALKVTATDEAGNAGEATARFTTETSWDALIGNIDHYAALKLFKNKGEAKMLKTQIAHLRQTAEFLEKYDLFFRWHPRLRTVFEREMRHHLSALENYVKHRSGKSIDPSAADRLVENLNFLGANI